MSERNALICILATGLVKAVAADERDTDGFNLSAGRFGPNVSAWIRGIALEFELATLLTKKEGP